MSEVKRFDVPSMRSLTQGEQAVMGYEVVLASDYDTLAAEAQALREELAALRARVVVLPSVDNVMNIVMRYQWNEKTNVTGTTNWAANLGMRVVEEVKRLNGLTVSEGLLRRIAAPVNNQDELDAVHEARIELRALLNEDKENGNG
ncbi:hypothetical protein [Pseudomonas aeruginosa]|uniref:hypothetical protein n=1 Tax=Pseudomonas aeruginosa TaxID=287 RepID=UPI0029C0E5FB|nr:hypothetical protein [Pseudomonas aeruginosa]